MKYLLGLIGHPVSQSMSPPLHRAALSYFGMDGDYKLFDVEPQQLAPRLAQLQAEGLHGFNITIPHKIAVYNLCHDLTEQARSVGAANTVLIGADGRLTGHNTDFMGLYGALAESIDGRRDTACILGAGGAAKAAIRVLEKLGFNSIIVFARDVEKAAATVGLKVDGEDSIQSFSADVSIKSADLKTVEACKDQLNKISLVINCLPLGQTVSEIPSWLADLLKARVPHDSYVYDMVYSKTSSPTLLVDFAQAEGFKSADGMSMLVSQAMYAFSFWTGQLPPYAVMEAAFLKAKNK